MKTEALLTRLREEIEAGRHGRSGDHFLTTRELARRYGVSLESASLVMRRLAHENRLVLDGKHYYLSTGYASPATPYGKLLASRRQRILALELNRLDNPFFSALADSLNREAKRHGYSLVVQSSRENSSAERENLKLFLDMNVSGVFTCTDIHTDFGSVYRNYVLPVVVLGRNIPLPNCDSVSVGNHVAGAQVASHLSAVGCRSFAYLGLRDYLDRDPRLHGYVGQLEKLGKALFDTLPVESAADDTLHARVRNLIASAPKPLGLFCYHDLLAVEAARAIKRSRFPDSRIPDDVCVVGFDDLPISSAVTPPLSTISYQYASIAERAMERMLSYIENPEHIPGVSTVASVLTVRESSMRKKD